MSILKLKSFVWFVLAGWVFLIPLMAWSQLFQNNNQSCEDKVVVGAFEAPPAGMLGNPFVSASISCGRFSDDTQLGNPDFADCLTQVDPLPVNSLNIPGELPLSNSYLANTGAHGNNCLNAGEANPQFASSFDMQNQWFTPSDTGLIRMGTVATGDLLDFFGFEDVVVINPLDNIDPVGNMGIHYMLSLDNGGFSSTTDFTPSVTFHQYKLLPFPTNLYGTYPPFSIGFGSNLGSERSSAILNCDDDAYGEVVLTIRDKADLDGDTFDDIYVKVLQNNGALLQDFGQNYPVYASLDPKASVIATLDIADFNQDSIKDVVVAIRGDNDPMLIKPSNDLVSICEGQSDCSFDCIFPGDMNVIDLTQLCGPNCQPFPTSVVAGDFNGDQLPDIAVAQSGTSSVRYFFNNGGALSTWQSQDIPLHKVADFPRPVAIQRGRFTSEAVKNHRDEVAVTTARFSVNQLGNFSAPQTASTVEVLGVNGQGTIQTLASLQFNPVLGKSISASSIAVKNFDHCGGDDLITLAHTEDAPDKVTRRASVFLNTNEKPLLTLLSNDLIEGKPGDKALLKANCEDATDDDRHYTWSILSAPEDSQTQLNLAMEGDLQGGNIQIENNIQIDRFGTYEIELQCKDFCGGLDIKKITILAEESPPPPPPPVPVPVPSSLTQGGCIASLLPTESFHPEGFVSLIIYSLGLWSIVFLRTIRKKR